MLSETRKYKLYCVMAHQNWSQASDRLKGALQNVGIEAIFKAGRPDAEYPARLFGTVDTEAVKHVVSDEAAEKRTHPTYYPLPEQWEHTTQQIQQLDVGEAFIRLPDDRLQRVHTPRLPEIPPTPHGLDEIERYYLDRYFEPAPPIETAVTPIVQARSTLGRRPRTQSRKPSPTAGTVFSTNSRRKSGR